MEKRKAEQARYFDSRVLARIIQIKSYHSQMLLTKSGELQIQFVGLGNVLYPAGKAFQNNGIIGGDFRGLSGGLLGDKGGACARIKHKQDRPKIADPRANQECVADAKNRW